MTILGELILGKRASTFSSFHPSSNPATWWPRAGDESATGLQVTERNSLGHTAVYQAVQIIAGLQSVMPCDVIGVTGTERKDARNHPLWKVLHEQPNPESSWPQFQTAQMLNKLTFGNRYAEIEYTAGGRNGMALWHLPSDDVKPRRVYKKAGGGLTFEAAAATPEDRRRGGTIVYEVRDGNGPPVFIEAPRMLHVPDMSFNGLVGFSRVRTILESIALGRARTLAVAAIYGNDSTPGGVLERPKEAPSLSPTGERNLIAAWEATHGGVTRKGRTAVLQEGTTFRPVSFSPRDAMVIEAGQFSILEIAHAFNLRPHWLGHPGNSNTYANVETEFTQLVQVTMMPHMRADEMEMRRKLLFPNEQGRMQIEYDAKGLMRGDSSGRAAFYKQLYELGVLTPNMIAQAENLPRVPPEQGGDDYRHAQPEPQAAPAQPPQRGVGSGHLVAAFRPLLQDAAARCVAKEVAAVRRAAAEPGLADWLPGFYAGHRRYVAKVMGPVVEAYLTAQGRAAEGAGAEVADRLCVESATEIRMVLAKPMSLSAGHVEEILTRREREWPAHVAAEEIA